MNLLDIEQLSNYYPINPVVEVKELSKGNTSNAKLIVTMDGKYILRKLKDSKQAMTEFIISNELSKQNISPTILLTNNNYPYIKDKDDVYNFQCYMENHKVKNKEIDFYNLGKTISIFHSKTKSIQGIYEQNDRFSLREMWNQLIEIKEFNRLEYKTQLLILFKQCLNYKHDKNCFIHGDLGIWNVLFNDKEIHLIDYGEVRKGNNHFDMSAVISSTINWNQKEVEIISLLIDFRNGYISNFDTFNWTVLKENFTLWFTRGIIAVLIHQGINERTNKYAKETMERENKLARIIEANFI